MSSQPTKPSESGFTLVEVLLATALVAVIATMVFGSLHLSTVAIDRTRDAASRDQVLRSTLRIMAEELTAGLSHTSAPWIGIDGQWEGQPADTVAFLTLGQFHAVESSQDTELVRIVYTREGDRLLRFVRRNLYGINDETVEQIELASNVKGFNLRYYDSQANLWSDTWDGRARSVPPASVLIELTIMQNEYDSQTVREWVSVGIQS